MTQTSAASAAQRLTLQTFQSDRLRRDHADLAAEPQFRDIAEFFFAEIYGPRDFTNRDAQARRLHAIVGYLPGVALKDVESVLQLLELTQRLDDTLLAALRQLGHDGDALDAATYDCAYRLADNYDRRVEQLELIRASMYRVHDLTMRPLFGAALARVQPIAQLAGLGEIVHFLALGYRAVKPVREIHRFVETIIMREHDLLDRVYARDEP